jgi:hypothetical protein
MIEAKYQDLELGIKTRDSDNYIHDIEVFTLV